MFRRVGAPPTASMVGGHPPYAQAPHFSNSFDFENGAQSFLSHGLKLPGHGQFFMQNHFDLFQLPIQFALDTAALDQAYREVQARVHPDKFVSASEAEKRVAMQWATRANEAYQTLKHAPKRAQYLCELHGVSLQAESNTAMSAAFLMQQMEWREALQDARQARDLAALEALSISLRSNSKALIAQVAQALDQGQYEIAAGHLRSLMFVDKFAEELELAFEMIEA